ncbi:MAG: rRNA adenine N-6-methyltransferase family protein [Patescibacteria group bacterium]|jgi:16S rRNA (adenine1518-N6/adenine1519-N6)-dimethyltransferase
MQNLRERTQAYAAHLGMKPTKSLGQHFLVNEAVLKKIIGTAGDINGVPVLEIGPGLGVLTEQLVQAGAHITAVELDRTCAAFLQKQFSTVPAVRVVQDDIFRWFSLNREELLKANIILLLIFPIISPRM